MFEMFTHVQVRSSHSLQCVLKLPVTVDLLFYVSHKTVESQATVNNSSIH